MDSVNDENMHLIVEDENGEQLDCEVLMYYDCLDNGLKYVFYTDNLLDEDGEYNIYASRFLGIDDSGEIQIGDIESEEEWALLDDVLDQAKMGLENKG